MGVKIPLACEQAIHLEESREVTRERHTKGDTTVRGASRGFAARTRVISRLASLATQNGVVARWLGSPMRLTF